MKVIKIERKFDTKDGDNTITLGIVKPTQKIIQESQMQYSKAFSDYFRKGLLLNKEVEKIVKERDLWDEKSREEFNDLQEGIQKKEDFLNEKNLELNDEDAITAAYELSALREEKWRLQREVQSIYDNTAERRAEDVRVQYLTSQCIYDVKTNKSYFKNYEDFIDKSDTQVVGDSIYQMMIYLNGLEQNFMDVLPETKYIKGIFNKKDEGKVEKDEKEKAEENKPVTTEEEKRAEEPKN
jgi:hypothetical protein